MGQITPEFRIQTLATIWVNGGRSTVDKWITVSAAHDIISAERFCATEKALTKKQRQYRIQQLQNGKYRTI